MEIVCAQALTLTGALGSSVSLVEDEYWLRVAHSCGKTGHAVGRFSAADSLLGMVVRRSEPVLINNRSAPGHDEFTRAPRSLMVVPLRSQGKTIDVLDVVNKTSGFTVMTRV